jgi:hypothetical protein
MVNRKEDGMHRIGPVCLAIRIVGDSLVIEALTYLMFKMFQITATNALSHAKNDYRTTD